MDKYAKIIEWLYQHDNSYDSSKNWKIAFSSFLKNVLKEDVEGYEGNYICNHCKVNLTVTSKKPFLEGIYWCPSCDDEMDIV